MTAASTVPPPRSLTAMQPFFTEHAVNRETALALLEGLTPAQLAWRPSPTAWGLGDISGHIALTTMLSLPAFDVAIAEGHDHAAYSDLPFAGNLLSRATVWFVEPPVRLRLRAPHRLTPRPLADPAQARQEYRAAQIALELRLERAAGLDLTHVKVRLASVRPVRVALGTAFALLLAHERRHLWQAARVRQAHAFPAANARADQAPPRGRA